MRTSFIVAFALLASACTKKNPDLCCTTQADCDSVGVPLGTGCSGGLVCRGNQCIAETCSSSMDCDAAAPFCDGQSCLETCSMDSECPGFGEDVSAAYCENGDCVACRIGMNDCAAAKPVCDSGACRACVADADCASDVCDVGMGSCRDAATVLYASPAGTATGACTQADPCTIAHAISLVTATRELIRLADGTYHEDLAFPAGIKATIEGGMTEVIGTAAITLIDIGANSNITFRNGKYTSGIISMAPPQHIFLCVATAAQPSTLSFQNVSADGGLPSTSNNCKLTIQRSTFGDITGENGGSMAIDQSTIKGGLSFLSDANNLQLDIKNTAFNHGIQFPGSGIVSGTVAFSTFAMMLYASCSGHVLFVNNIFFSTNYANAGYAIQHSAPCTSTFDHNLEYPQDVPVGTNTVIGDPKLKDVPGGDFHLLVNSAAVDAADPAATDAYDFDGTPRPQGSGRDIGAFEYH